MRVASFATKWWSWLTKSTVPFELQEALEQALDGLDVEVVGGLVEHQHVVPAQDDLGQKEPRGLAAGQGPRSASAPRRR
jgi:hypothetical protein